MVLLLAAEAVAGEGKTTATLGASACTCAMGAELAVCAAAGGEDPMPVDATGSVHAVGPG